MEVWARGNFHFGLQSSRQISLPHMPHDEHCNCLHVRHVSVRLGGRKSEVADMEERKLVIDVGVKANNTDPSTIVNTFHRRS